jgi:UDP-N-acetylmuramoylalanine--D-glutamate ligase
VLKVAIGKTKVIVGLGKTGYSCARYLRREGVAFIVMDDADKPRFLDQLLEDMPDVSFSKLESGKLLQAEEILLSPGVPLQSKKIVAAVRQGVPVTGDIAIFASRVKKPLVAITGSNGKSTVTQLVADMAEACGLDMGMGGNIGVPCLDIIQEDHEAFVLEVSSYQLEVVEQLNAKVALVLNLSPDHLDRYVDVEQYFETKARVYRGCEFAIRNRDTTFDFKISPDAKQLTFGTGAPDGKNSFGIEVVDGVPWLCFEAERLLDANSLKIKGKHNWQNALAALAVGYAMGLDFSPMIDALKNYAGLPHRCEWLGRFSDADVFNDSKSTNPGSTEAAVDGLSTGANNILLILGGDGKGADFSSLRGLVSKNARRCFVYGKDRAEIALALGGNVVIEQTLADVVQRLKDEVVSGDQVLFSPACASMDQFRNYQHRGEEFKRLVEETLA